MYKKLMLDLDGYALSYDEIDLLMNSFVGGVILFSRNIKSIEQLKLLINSIKILFNDKKFPILLDQEGGKVSRLNKIIDLSFFSQKLFAKFYKKDKILFLQFYQIYINSICDIFKYV